MWHWLYKRYVYLHDTQFRRSRGVVAVLIPLLYGLAALYDFFVSQFVEEPDKWWRARDIFGLLSWEQWSIVGLAVVVALIFEGGYRQAARLTAHLDERKEKMEIQAGFQRDVPRAAAPELFLINPDYELGISGQRNFEGLGIPDGEHVAKVSIIAVSTGPMVMEQFRLRVAGEEFPALRASTIETWGETMGASWTFEIPESIPLGSHPATFLVFGAGQWWTSNPFDMDLRWD